MTDRTASSARDQTSPTTGAHAADTPAAESPEAAASNGSDPAAASVERPAPSHRVEVAPEVIASQPQTEPADVIRPPVITDAASAGARLTGLHQAVEAAEGRLREADLEPARQLVARAGDRLRLSGEHTIVALAGATGSGKSSLFNALTDLELAGTGVRRPTTSWALACAWGPEGAEGLLDWMGIPPRHQISRMHMLDRSPEDQKLDGLILLDLPDHDSTEVAHHLEMDRLVRLADVVIWVLDPQKYADAAIHERYIRPMASHRDVTLVVLNQIDRIPYEERARALADVRRIIYEAGLIDVPVIGVSATRGDGVTDLKRELAGRIRAKKSARERLLFDLDEIVASIVTSAGMSQGPGVGPLDEEALDLAVLDAAGGPQFVDAVEASTRRRAMRLMGWPLMRLALGWRHADGFQQLGVGLSADDLPDDAPIATGSQASQVEAAVRELSERATVGLLLPWRHAVHSAALSSTDDVVRRLDQVMVELDRSPGSTRVTWRLGWVLQWLLLAIGVAGAAWSVAYAFGVAPSPEVSGSPLAYLLAALGLGGGIVFDLLARAAVYTMAKIRARRADRVLVGEVSSATQELVIRPVRDELARYERYRLGMVGARG